MRIVNKNSAQNAKDRFINPLNKKIIYEKRKMYEEIFVKGK